MWRVLRERGMGGLGGCGHQPAHAGARHKSNDSKSGRARPSIRPPGQVEANTGRQEEHPPGLLLATGTGSSSSRVLRSSGRRKFDPRAPAVALPPRADASGRVAGRVRGHRLQESRFLRFRFGRREGRSSTHRPERNGVDSVPQERLASPVFSGGSGRS